MSNLCKWEGKYYLDYYTRNTVLGMHGRVRSGISETDAILCLTEDFLGGNL